MEENSPSSCLTFLHHEAARRSRLSKSKKKRLPARDLLHACVKLVDDYSCEALPDIAPDDHAKILMPTLNVSDMHDQIFLTQVLYGCCRYKKLLEILTTKLFSCKSPNVQCIDETLYTVLGYLALIRLEELTFGNFRKFVLSQHPQKLLPFMRFVFNQEDLFTFCKPEWIKVYDTEYVDSIIRRLTAWATEAEELSRRLEEKILFIKQRDKKSTAFKPFNLSTPPKKLAVVEEEKATPFRARPSPNWREGLTPTQKALEAVCKESREKLAKFYSNPKNQPFHLHILERPSRFAAVKERIESVRKLETEYIPPKARPCPEPPASGVKLTTSAVLREHALYQKQFEEERQRIQAFEVDLRDDSDYKYWQEELRSKDQIKDSIHRRFRKAAVDACDQAAADARCAKAQENRKIVRKVKEESQKLDALKEEFFVNLELFNQLRRENIIEGHKAVKTLEAESAQIMKKFNRESTAGHGLLGEMSISELQKRLALVKQAIKKEEEYRRVRINASKDENINKLVEKSAFVKKMRQLAHVQRIARKEDKNLAHIPRNEMR